ncbi:MAG TPA: tetratricopeptide repeat protein [Candidatus Acidoferrales bacterium]|nr:tetratricopeptide repeat protein [Candidatus Acidoferrales bacterium]
MRNLALFAVPAVLIFTLSVHSQESRGASVSETSSTAPAMTPEQTAEMRADILMARKEYAAAIDVYLSIARDRKLPAEEHKGFFGRLFAGSGEPKGDAQDRHHDAVLLNKLGVAYQELGGNDAAESYYKRAEAADKTFATPVNNLGTLEYGLHHYSKSVNYYKRALRMGASEATVYSNLGYSYYSAKKYDLAMDSFNKALAIDPTIFDNHSGAGGSIMQQRSAPDPGTLNFFLAKAYARLGDAEHAAHYLKLARDYGYKDMPSVSKDKDFAAVIKDPRVQDVLHNRPSFTDADSKPVAN